MKRLMMLISAAALLSLSWTAASAVAAVQEEALGTVGDPGKGRIIFDSGKGDDVPACAGCHGTGGMGSDEMSTPRLAYQVQKYVWKQLEDFAAGKRWDNKMFQMNDIAKALTREERRDVAAYVHTLKTPTLGSDLDAMRREGSEDGEPIGVVHKGKIIAEYGLPDHGVPACMSCHAFHGRSAGNMYPAIGGQKYVYLKHELEAFRMGATSPSSEDNMDSRDNDPKAQMRKVAANMTDEDIANVAAFLTVARPSTGGNPSAPRH